MQETVTQANAMSGYFQMSDWSVVEVFGPESADFLHRMSTVDIKKLKENQCALGAFLTGKGTLISFGYFYRTSEGFLYVSGPHQAERAYAHLDQYHFQEKLTIQKKSSEEWGVLSALFPKAPLPNIHWQDPKSKGLNWMLSDLKTQNVPLLSMDLFHLLRVQSGMPYWGWEVFEGDLVLEAGLEAAVARNKGCYPGQEVVERIFSYGQVNWKLIRVELRSEIALRSGPCQLSICLDGKEVGQLRSVVRKLETPLEGWGLARLRKEAWVQDQNWEVEPGTFLKLSKVEE